MKKMVECFACTILVFIVSMMMFGLNGKAYIDPSVMTYTIQAVAGIIIAIGAAIGIYWRKAKRKVQDKLGLEDTKEMESDEIIVNSESKED